MNAETNVCLIVTASSEEIETGDLERLLISDARHAELVVVVWRRSAPTQWPGAPLASNCVLVEADPCGVSKARNLGLKALLRNFKGRNDWIVGFPDDDCTYAEGTLTGIKEHFTETIDALCIPYGPSQALVDRRRFPANSSTISPRSALRSVASAGLFVRVTETRRVTFNETLGVGALLQSCEDVDVVLQMIKTGASVRYEPNPIVRHPYGGEAQLQRQAGRLALIAGRRADFGGFPTALARALVGLLIRALRKPALTPSILAAITLGLRPTSIRAVKQPNNQNVGQIRA